MKAKVVQKMLVITLAAMLVATPSMALTVNATEVSEGEGSGSEGEGSGSEGEGSGSKTEEKNESSSVSEKEVVSAVNESISSAAEDGGANETVSSIAQIPTSSTVAGVKSSVNGVYVATSVNGTAITTSLANIANSYNLSSGEKPYARIYNMDVKKSSQAASVINQAAEAMGAAVGPYVNVELGKMGGGKFSLLPSDGAAVTLKFGIPKSFAQSGKTYAVVCVRPGGAVTILEDTDSNPDTVTFNTTGGQGAYAIIKY